MSQNRQFIAVDQARAPFFVGLDLGGTDVKVGVIDDLGRPLCWQTTPDPTQNGPEDACRRVGKTVLEAIQAAGLEPAAVVRAGLGSAGILDSAAGILLKPVNLKGWDNFPLRDRINAHCGLPVTLANDANAAAYGEFWVGSGRDFHSMVLFTLGTGIGSGIIVGDLAIDGEHNCGAECGHIVIDCTEDARLCGCGQRGHLEAYASGTARSKRAREALDAGRPSSLHERLAQCPHLTPKLVAHEAEAGDALALGDHRRHGPLSGHRHRQPDAHHQSQRRLAGRGHDLRRGPGALGRRFLGWIKEEVCRRAFRGPAEQTVIDFATLGGDAGYIGAAGLARLEHRKLAKN